MRYSLRLVLNIYTFYYLKYIYANFKKFLKKILKKPNRLISFSNTYGNQFNLLEKL